MDRCRNRTERDNGNTIAWWPLLQIYVGRFKKYLRKRNLGKKETWAVGGERERKTLSRRLLSSTLGRSKKSCKNRGHGIHFETVEEKNPLRTVICVRGKQSRTTTTATTLAVSISLFGTRKIIVQDQLPIIYLEHLQKKVFYLSWKVHRRRKNFSLN